jgi:hypothetical protein
VAALHEEKQAQMVENQKLSDRLSRISEDSFGLDDPDSPASQRVKQLSQQLERLNEDMYRIEAGTIASLHNIRSHSRHSFQKKKISNTRTTPFSAKQTNSN